VADDAFIPGPKAIYRYHNGKEMVCADPMLIEGCLETKAIARGTSMSVLYDKAQKKLSESDEPTKMEIYAALAMLAELSRESFALEPFDKTTGNGADMDHCLSVLSHFNTWREKKNPPTETSSTSSPSATSIPPLPAQSSSTSPSITNA
jgi:hypothetical protein